MVLSHRKNPFVVSGSPVQQKYRLQSTGPESLWHNLSKLSLRWFCSTLHKVRLWPKNSFEVAGDTDHSSVLLGHNELTHKFPEFKKNFLLIAPLVFEISAGQKRGSQQLGAQGVTGK